MLTVKQQRVGHPTKCLMTLFASLVPSAAAWVPPGKPLRTQILQLYPRLTESDFGGEQRSRSVAAFHIFLVQANL